MPPKQQQAPNKKSQEKIKNKIIEDKTFGLKNKKGAKQQKFIQQVQKQVQNKMAPKNPRDIVQSFLIFYRLFQTLFLFSLIDSKAGRSAKEKRGRKEEEGRDRRVVQARRYTNCGKRLVLVRNFNYSNSQYICLFCFLSKKGVDPKSVVCVYFKQNLCQKGDKCKFSHDLSIERKSEKRNVYEDIREQDSMENWDDQKLEDVVNRKHGEDNVKKNQTQIVSEELKWNRRFNL